MTTGQFFFRSVIRSADRRESITTRRAHQTHKYTLCINYAGDRNCGPTVNALRNAWPPDIRVAATAAGLSPNQPGELPQLRLLANWLSQWANKYWRAAVLMSSRLALSNEVSTPACAALC